ncbi:hypothetical protein C2845_PM05G36050 [Panicum miliaceum]|uniref:Uncharacterized protein n=1 Tax=Panicum miliaceum TaxID=4540 RepID=A0A3L6SVD9_PANMI|nr:hypothetical protein C2845_PM05G36050 [Panicum miliaceum]
MRTKLCVTFRPTVPKKSAVGRERKREGEGEGGSPPSAKVTETMAEGEWRASTIRERDLLRLVAERVLQEERVVQWRTAGSDSSPWENTAASPAFPKKSNYSMRAQCRMSFPRRKHVAPLPPRRGRTEVVVMVVTCDSAAAGRPEQEEVARGHSD